MGNISPNCNLIPNPQPQEREGRTREHEESERQRKVEVCVCEKDSERVCEAIVCWTVDQCAYVRVCVCVCVCLCSLADEAKLILWWARGSPVKKTLLKVLLFPRDCSQIITHTHTHTQRVLCCLHTLWLRCHLSQARCGWAGSCVCGCFALQPSSRIFIINEVTDYTFQISSCSMCWADVVALLLEWEWITV